MKRKTLYGYVADLYGQPLFVQLIKNGTSWILQTRQHYDEANDCVCDESLPEPSTDFISKLFQELEFDHQRSRPRLTQKQYEAVLFYLICLEDIKIGRLPSRSLIEVARKPLGINHRSFEDRLHAGLAKLSGLTREMVATRFRSF